jgi:hypothetical protein
METNENSLVYNPKMKTELSLGPVRPNFHRTFFAPHPSQLLFFNTAYRGEPLECPPVRRTRMRKIVKISSNICSKMNETK